ncbi:laccase-1-like isoform X2 [Chelonus insularis]|uniref:laccase-1-like isoform X2 n=1 Tax=Chelonus insularis TaxID=460826 RepID=UPI001589A5C4|nr:laccase-1-like isoform X2 [Chelonus insularis]
MYSLIYSKSSSGWRTYPYKDDGSSDDTVTYKNQKYPVGKGLSSPQECARPCTTNTKPRICYYHWTFEYYRTLGEACHFCQPSTNASIVNNCQCILADGVEVSGIIVANRMYPGPSIQVCLGDIVVVDVENLVAGNELSIHWHGIYQQDWQYFDGVPFVTQCPIAEGTTFRYQWRAQNPGSHFWHAHTGLHKAEGVDGAIVIRQPHQDEPNHDLYDSDDFDNIIFISDWMHESVASHFPGTTTRNVGQDPDNFLINGRGQWMNSTDKSRTTTPLATFNVRKNMRYRLRIINSCAFGCPVQLTIQNHYLTIIALDGEDVKPQRVKTITTYSAERVDAILEANQPAETYWIQIRGLSQCAEKKLQQHGILRYVGSHYLLPKTPRPAYNPGLPRGLIFNDIHEICNGTRKNVICVQNLQSFYPVHKKILQSSPDFQVFLPFFFHEYTSRELFRTQPYQRFVVPDGSSLLSATLNGISNVFPSSPLVSQLKDIPQDQICNSNRLPAYCKNSSVCRCTHVIHVPLNAVVDILMIDGAPNGISHPFHLHGYGFHVLAQGLLSGVNITAANKKWALELHRRKYPSTNKQPPTKDTLAVASGGYTIVRFIADNPGWWLYHCHFLPHLYNGMSLVFQVGESKDLPPVPPGFPTCGNFLPEIYRTNPTSVQDNMMNNDWARRRNVKRKSNPIEKISNIILQV